jgi:ABC-type uncharacterized transport system permease subunit
VIKIYGNYLFEKLYQKMGDYVMLKLVAFGSVLAYSISTALTIWQLRSRVSSRKPLFLAWVAVFLHILYISLLCEQQNGFNFSILSVASLNILGVMVILLLTIMAKPVEKLGLLLFPLAAIILALDASFNSPSHLLSERIGWAMEMHILTSILAFSLLTIAAVQAILLAIQEYQLKQHPPSHFSLLLPSLLTMEALLFQLITAGVSVLTISLGTGFLFLHNLFAQHLAHKTILSLLAWGIFCAILIGRKLYGWRGRVAVNWILAGFLLLLLGYFGSKFVLELILLKT